MGESELTTDIKIPADSAGTRKASWLYCWVKAGNLTSHDGTKNTCPGGTTYTYNDASELTGRNGSTTGWAYDKLGNETAGTGGTARTNETWTDYSQLAGITAGGKTYDLVHAGTSNSERTKLGSTWFHHTALGLASTTTNGVDTGFIREPAGTLNSMTTGGEVLLLPHRRHRQRPRPRRQHRQAHPHLRLRPHGLPRTTPTEAVPQPYRYAGAYADPTGLYKMGHRYYDPTLGRFTQPDPSGQEKNPYLYAGGDPVNRTDPTGLWSLEDFSLKAAGAALAGAVGGCVTGGITAALGGPAGIAAGCATGAVVGGYGGLATGATDYAWSELTS